MTETKIPDDFQYPNNWTMLLTPNDFGDYVLNYKQIKELLGAWQLRENRLAAAEAREKELREEITSDNNEISTLRAKIAEATKPVTDEEALNLYCHCVPPTLQQMEVIRRNVTFGNLLLAARAAKGGE